MLVNTLLIPIMGATVKTLAEMDVGTLEMLTWRAEIVLVLLLPFLLKAEHREAVRTADIRAHAIHAAFAIATMACFYFALRTLPLATVTSINFTTPIFALLLAWLLFGERVSLAGWSAMGAGFLGTILILRPDASGIGLDVVVVLVGSILAAGMNLAVRRMPARSSNYAVVFYLSLFGAIFYALIGGPSLRMPTATEFGLYMALGVLALGIHTCVTFAFRFATSMLIGALDYARIVWAILIGLFFFAEQPDFMDGLGIVLIVLSGWVVMRSPKASPPQNAA
ncbi:MAG: DMT family transporter [Paracoccaceae bacterium]|nr:DMT family transporter [Paracoccaceae bacterium]